MKSYLYLTKIEGTFFDFNFLPLKEQCDSGLTQRTLELIPSNKEEKEALKIIQLGGFPCRNINNVSLVSVKICRPYFAKKKSRNFRILSHLSVDS